VTYLKVFMVYLDVEHYSLMTSSILKYLGIVSKLRNTWLFLHPTFLTVTKLARKMEKFNMNHNKILTLLLSRVKIWACVTLYRIFVLYENFYNKWGERGPKTHCLWTTQTSVSTKLPGVSKPNLYQGRAARYFYTRGTFPS